MPMIICNHTLSYFSPQVSADFCPRSGMQPSQCTMYSLKLHRLPIQKIFFNRFNIFFKIFLTLHYGDKVYEYQLGIDHFFSKYKIQR